jgi:AcrR family transcriptional regulator
MTSPAETPERRARLNRAQVLQAAAELADRAGLDDTTLSALARELGIRTPSLYRHVDSLAALVEGIATIALDELRAAMADAAAGRSGPEAVRAGAHAYRAYAQRHPGRYAATTAFAVRAGHDEFARAAAALVDILRATLRHWDLDDDRQVDAIRGLRAALHGFVEIERTGGFGMDRSPDASFDVLVTTIIAGLDAASAST